MPHRQTLHLICQPALLYWCLCLFCWGVPMKPLTLKSHDNLKRWLVFASIVLPAWCIQGGACGEWIGGLWWCKRNLAFCARQSSWDHHVGGHSAQGWLRPIWFECVQENSHFPQLPPEQSAYSGHRGWGASASVPYKRLDWAGSLFWSRASGQYGPSKVLLAVSVCLEILIY